MDQAIQDFVECKRVAVVGVSRSSKKFGAMACKELKERGYRISIVHPEAREIAGDPCYPDLAALKDKVDGVLVIVPPGKAAGVLREAAAAGLRKVWLQQGAESEEVLALGRELGLRMVSKKCILMYAPPVRSFHWFHRLVVRLFGRL